MNIKMMKHSQLTSLVKRFLGVSLVSLTLLSAGQAAANEPPPFATQPWGEQGVEYKDYHIQRVSFDSDGDTVVGNLFLPKQTPKAAIAILGPVGSVKEQSPIQYASRLVKAGYAALIFDARFFGESGGEPRQMESRQHKVADIKATLPPMSVPKTCLCMCWGFAMVRV